MNKIEGQMKAIDKFFGDVIGELNKIKAAKPHGYETTIEINGYEFDCIVDYEYEPACAGGRGDFGMKTEPDSPAHINMGQVWIFDEQWNLTEIPELAMTEILEEILDHHTG